MAVTTVEIPGTGYVGWTLRHRRSMRRRLSGCSACMVVGVVLVATGRMEAGSSRRAWATALSDVTANVIHDDDATADVRNSSQQKETNARPSVARRRSSDSIESFHGTQSQSTSTDEWQYTIIITRSSAIAVVADPIVQHAAVRSAKTTTA